MRIFFKLILSVIFVYISFLRTGYASEQDPSTDHTFMVNASVYADNDTGDNNTANTDAVVSRCNAVKSIKIPHEDLPLSLKNCDPGDYFYGINNHTVDYEKARQCALNTLNDKNAILNSYQILEMIYANGYGVKQNIDLATKFACDNGESNQLILDLASKKFNKNHPFDVCIYTDEPNTITICENFIPMKINETERNIKIKQIISKWSIAEQKSFKVLEKVKDDYIDFYVNGELDLSVYEDRRTYDTTDELNAVFFDHFMDIVNGKLPHYSDQQFAELDRKLNQVYQQVMAEKEDTYPPGVTHNSIRNVQRAWIQYRDAWVDFALKLHPEVSANSIKAMLTKDRIDDLEMMLPSS